MRPYCLGIILSFFIGYSLNAQTIITGVVTDSGNAPIPFASVYLSKTTIGTTTNNEGVYTLMVPQSGEYELISSCIGYNSNSLPISAAGKKLTINLKMSQNQVQLEEVTVQSKAKKRIKNYTQFTKLLLGETENAQFCTIRNIEDLFIYGDSQSDVVSGRSHKPLQIENKALGYLINYDLTDFVFDAKNGLLKFTGGIYFQPLPGNPRNIQKWTHNRLSAYYGSKMHFLRALFADSLVRESYKISDCRFEPVKTKSGLPFMKAISLPSNSAQLTRKPNLVNLSASKPMLITWFDNHPELASEVIGYEPRKYESTLELSDTLKIFPNGYFVPPFSATWGGEMGNGRIADMLPFDFLPGSKPWAHSDSDAEDSPAGNPLTTRQKNPGREQVFVHLDRNIYRPGDTIFFKAYVKDGISGTFESQSLSLYALLFNERKAMADSSRYKIDHAQASGWMAIPAKAEPGRYHFAAFTSMMQNYDPAEAFQTEIEVREPNGTDKKPSVVKTTDNQYFELRFLPEGGTYAEGIRQRVGFNATNGTGEPVPIEGLLKDSAGATLDTLKSGAYGPGSFVCKAQPGLFVEITKGAAVKKLWPLPQPEPRAVTLSVSPLDERSFLVEIESNNYFSEPMTVVVNMDLTQVFSREITLNKKQQIVVETGQFPSGVADISLLDKAQWPVAERLWYVNSDKHLKYHISTNTAGPETELSVVVTDGQGNPVEGTFSIAVTDSVKGINPEIFTPGIEYALNYHAWFPGNLPGMALARGLENMSDEERNLLLMVYGWSKINRESTQEMASDKQLVNFDLMSVKLLNTLKRQRPERKLDLYSLEGLTIKHLITNTAGEAFLPLDSLPDVTRSVTILPDVKTKNRVLEAMLSIPYDAGYFKSKKLLLPQPRISLAGPMTLPGESQRPAPSTEEKYTLGEKTIEIQEVIVVGHPENKKLFHDKDEQKYRNSNIRSIDIEPLQSSYSLEIALRKLISPYQITETDIIMRPPRSIFGLGGPVTALIVLDGMPLYFQGWAMVKDISPTEVTSLTILNGQQGFARYGDGAQGGVIFVNTRSNNEEQVMNRTKWGSQNKNGNMLKPIELYRKNVEFYCPTKLDGGIDPLLQGRATIFWQPDVYFNGKMPVKIKYNNLKHTGPMSVIINGISVNNLSGTGRASVSK